VKNNTPIRVLIAEDHELARTGLSYAIQGNPQFQVSGEADNGVAAVAQASEHQPHVVLMDIDMPEMDGILATRKIKETLPDVKVIMLTSQGEQEQVYQAFSAGADGYCLKDIRIERLFTVIEMVAEGGIWIDPPIAGFILNRINRSPLPENVSKHLEPEANQGNTLTEREMETLTLIVAGKSNKEIANLMSVSTNTIKTYVGKIIQKLAVDDRTQAAVKALQSGLVKPESG
jgi:DNA-binding NarL/FixJ family response regulator